MGLINKLKSAMGISDGQNTSEFQSLFDACAAKAEKQPAYIYYTDFSDFAPFATILQSWDDEKRGAFILFLTSLQKANYNAYEIRIEKEFIKFLAIKQLLRALLKIKMKLSESTFLAMYDAYKQSIPVANMDVLAWWPLSEFYNQIEHNYTVETLPLSIKKILSEILDSEKLSNAVNIKERLKLEENISRFLFYSENDSDAIQPIYFKGGDGFVLLGNTILEQQKKEDQERWFRLMRLAQKATGAKPSQKYMKEAKVIMDELGSDKFKRVTHEWFNVISQLKDTITPQTYTYEGRVHEFNTVEFISVFNADILKGFVWMSSWFYDNNTIIAVSKLAERCFKKIPGKGPAAAGLGNACLYTLYASKGLDGIAQLSRLRLKIKQSNTLTLIEKYISEAAIKLGVSSSEVEDLAVDDFKLQNHDLVYEFDDVKGVISLTGIGKSVIKWYKADGTEQKSVPQSVKDKFDARLKKFKAIQKQIDQTTASQKERFDRMLRSDRSMTLEYLKEKYLQHGLLSFAINKVIFRFTNDSSSCLAIYLNGKWVDVKNADVDIHEYTNVALWHPVTSSTQEVKAWREFLMNRQIQQPFKQAYREIYLLTEAEVNTRTYSNRMASHILKQHQYVTLAKGRNWKARLLGAWDGGDQDTAQLVLPEYKLSVEFWVSSLSANDQFNTNGIWNYVTTDQIRFINTATQDLVELTDIPPIVFSEAMRDVDLFVGVASVGNDPTWSDSGGLPNYRDYWQSYSFGDLSEIAKSRKEILQGLVPRLKIAAVTHIEDKFLVVKGKLRTYKIHIGSTNILMEPNDQYLCIVPDRSAKTADTKLFLPFEGDSGLSVIISKALLLANDDKITDTTITSQIMR